MRQCSAIRRHPLPYPLSLPRPHLGTFPLSTSDRPIITYFYLFSPYAGVFFLPSSAFEGSRSLSPLPLGLIQSPPLPFLHLSARGNRCLSITHTPSTVDLLFTAAGESCRWSAASTPFPSLRSPTYTNIEFYAGSPHIRPPISKAWATVHMHPTSQHLRTAPA